MALSGSLRDFLLEDILNIIHNERKTGTLTVSFSEEDEKKEIVLYFFDGEVASIVFGTLSGKPVIEKLASVSQGEFIFRSSDDLQIKQTLKLNFKDFVKIYKDSAEKWQPLRKLFPSQKIKVMLSDQSGEKVDFNKNEWRIVTSIGGGATIKTLLEKINIGELELLSLLKGLLNKNIIKLEENKDAEMEEEAKNIIPIALVWHRGRPIENKTATKLFKLMDNKKSLLQLAKELKISVSEAKKELDYLVKIGRVSIKK